MARTILMRLGYSLLSLLFVLMLVFVLVRLTGDPIDFLLEPGAPAEVRDALRERLALDKSIPEQFVAYVGQVTRGDLGLSFVYQISVTDLVAQRIPATATMAAGALTLTLLFGLPFGVYSAKWRTSLFDRGVRGFAAIGQSLPEFWIGFLLILLFAVNLKLLPPGGYGTVRHLILPSVTLALPLIAGLSRLLRSAMIQELSSDYVLFHRIKGVQEYKILWKYAFRNAGLTTLSYLGLLVAGLFTGSILVETIFAWQGIGLLFITGVQSRDFGVVQGVMLVYASAFLMTNFLVDVAYAFLNPRLRRG